MSFINLTGGAYQSRSLIAAAQRCVNLFPEGMPQSQGEPVAVTHYCTPGLTLQAVAPEDICRCLYTSSRGDLWACYGQKILYYSSEGLWTAVGTMYPSLPVDAVPQTTPVSMVDNGVTLLIVDGSQDGWTANVATHDGFARIDSGAEGYTGFKGGTYADFQDTFFILNAPGTPQFYISASGGTTFDPLDTAGLTAQVTELVAAVSIHRNLWLIGETSFEIWINNGGSGQAVGSFPFAIYPEAMGNWGCCAKYSIATLMNEVYWLHQDKFGKGMIMLGAALTAKRISTHAQEVAISKYARIDDAIGYCYQQQGHTFYVLTFPSANAPYGVTWVYDGTTGQWHERAWIDDNGHEWRHLSNACTAAYGKVYVGDWRNGNLYTYDLDNYTDHGRPIKRLRSFPHQIDLEANRRIMFHQLVAQMQVGAQDQTETVAQVIDARFVASNGTLLQNFSDINGIGARFDKIASINGVIIDNRVVAASPGSILYEASGVPEVPHYYVQFDMLPDNYDEDFFPPNGSSVYVTARANAENNGYLGGIVSDGEQYLAMLQVMDVGLIELVDMGTISSGSYQLKLNMQDTIISLSLYRTEDGLWLNSDGDWVSSSTVCIQIDDDTYSSAGRVLLGGSWQT